MDSFLRTIVFHCIGPAYGVHVILSTHRPTTAIVWDVLTICLWNNHISLTFVKVTLSSNAFHTPESAYSASVGVHAQNLPK